MKLGDNGHGYKFVSLCYGKKRYKNKYVHRLVASSFIANHRPSIRTQVNHIDGVKSNNCASNLEWCDQSENNRHGWNLGLFEAVRHAASHSAKSVPCEIVNAQTGELVASFPSLNSGLLHMLGPSRTCKSKAGGGVGKFGGLYPRGTVSAPGTKQCVFFRRAG
jgi:hypothetical protein